MSLPSISIRPSTREPRTRSLSRLRAQRKVDLPLRAGPMMPRISFRKTSRSRPSSVRAAPKKWLKPATRMATELTRALARSCIFPDEPVHEVVGGHVDGQDGDDEDGRRGVG